jgi:hypothetical protein
VSKDNELSDFLEFQKNCINAVFENPTQKEMGTSSLLGIIKDLIYLDILKQAQFKLLLANNPHYERKYLMEKYGVQIDKNKTNKKNKKNTPGEKTAGEHDPNINVPKDPNLGTEPYERKPKNG